MQEQTIKVTKCGECPFFSYGYGNGCNKDLHLLIVNTNEVHRLCPIKNKTIKIEVI